MKKEQIDFNNTKQLAEDVWFFLTDDLIAETATIKKEAAIHEISAMIDHVADVRSQQKAILFGKWLDRNTNTFRHDGYGMWHEYDIRNKATGQKYSIEELYDKCI